MTTAAELAGHGRPYEVSVTCVDPSASSRATVDVLATGHQLTADSLVSHGGEESAPHGLTFLSIAVSHCLMTELRRAAIARGIRLERLEVRTGTTFRVEDGQYAVDTFFVDLFVEGDLTEQQRDELGAEARERCGARRTLEAGARVVNRVHIGMPTDYTAS
ncbi:OsmC family protein [Streptomyces sp. NPDC057199]|uniref:OsmC family protein n=1 Tax=Streptomyces sp. NPDC057199 TaxID=3346047 RepID=UPI0036416F14